MSTLWGLLIAVAIIGLVSGFVIWAVSKLGLGLEVGGFVAPQKREIRSAYIVYQGRPVDSVGRASAGGGESIECSGVAPGDLLSVMGAEFARLSVFDNLLNSLLQFVKILLGPTE